MSVSLGSVIDRLPERWWAPANLHLGGSVHLCVGSDELGRPVRTVEWRGRELAHGHKPFDVAAHEQPGSHPG